MEDHETRRKIIREWMALLKDKRHTEEQVVAFAKKATLQNEFHRSRRDPDQRFRRDPYQKVMGWLLPRAGKLITDTLQRVPAGCEGHQLQPQCSKEELEKKMKAHAAP